MINQYNNKALMETEIILHKIFNDAAYIILDMAWPHNCNFTQACEYGYCEKILRNTPYSKISLHRGIWRACKNGHITIVRLLLENGANPNNGFNCACSSGYINIVNLLIQHGANNWSDGLSYAYKSNNIDIVNLIKSKIIP